MRNGHRLRIVVCTSGGAFGWVVLRTLQASERLDVVGIVQSSRVLKPGYSWFEGACEQIRLSGIRYALYLWSATALAEWLIGWREPRLPACRRGRVPTHVTRNLNALDTNSFLRTLEPDLLVSAFFNQRIEAHIRCLPRYGAVNLHPSLLPEFRGVDPVFFALLNGHRNFGVTVHRMDDTLDTGRILAQQHYQARSDASVFGLTAQLYQLGAQLLIDRLDSLTDGSAGIPQAPGGHYDSWPSREDVAAFAARRLHLVRWEDLLALLHGQLGAFPAAGTGAGV